MSVAEATGRVHALRGGMLGSELKLILTRRRNLVGLAIMCLVPIVMGVVLWATGSRDGGGPPFLSSIFGNGLFLILTNLLVQMTMFLPMAMSILAGDAIAGEANVGTLRYLLTVPVSRRRLLFTKFGALVTAAFSGVFLVCLVAGTTGVILFGTGDMLNLSGGTLPFAEALGRIALVAVYVSISLTAVCAIGLFASTLTEQPIGAAIATFIWVLLDQIFGGLSAMDWLHPFLLSHYWSDWAGLLRDPVDWGGVGGGLIAPLVYVAVFLSAAWARFTTADITS
ncbi:ABC-2 type transport system permease protein [Stackebrandtia endophytica]|uniref:ABC-2 type transport system permease protein n=1 Tax=Stackebrandtia endophytica TaxID=1496996 RepID=A0A543ARJ6_9ACTN|nr:ABC transporter permease subunit [Stackebrandtia endophytica]TQL75201.1 ABC-2 type transport system permease protein [Stackebrandtia endophytica]